MSKHSAVIKLSGIRWNDGRSPKRKMRSASVHDKVSYCANARKEESNGKARSVGVGRRGLPVMHVTPA
eukprot:6175789-Pleurochrysis_carterae.AAC.2